MKKSIITKLGSTVMALAIILMSVGVLTIAPTVSVAGTQDFFDDFSSYESVPYYDVNTALPYDGTAKVVATHSSGAEWRLSTVNYGRNLTTPAYMWIEAANKRLILSSSQGYPQAINLDIKKEASTYDINELSFDVVKNGYASTGMSMFISADEKTYYHIGLSGVTTTKYDVPKYTPFVVKVVNGVATTVYYDTNNTWTASDVTAHFAVTVSGSTISWTVTGATAKIWSGTATDTYISGKTWKYPCAAFANSSWDQTCAISNVEFCYKEITFADNFSSYTSAPYFDVNTALPYDGTAKVVATHSSGAEWKLSAVNLGRSLTAPAYTWIEAANKRLILSSSQGYPQAINLDIKKEASTYDINELSFDVVKNGYASTGMSMFISADEKTYYHIGLSGVTTTKYDVPKYTPFVVKVVNGVATTVYYDTNNTWTASDVTAHFAVTVSGSTISWTVTGATAKTWSGTATDTYISDKIWKYPCAAFANSSWDQTCAISAVKLCYSVELFHLGNPVLNASAGKTMSYTANLTSVSEEETSCVAIVGIYDEYNCLQDVNIIPSSVSASNPAPIEISFDTTNKNVNTIKTFVFDSLSGLNPLCKSNTFNLGNKTYGIDVYNDPTKPLTVAYIGGSITQLNKYTEPLSNNFFIANQPDRDITFVNAGISATCSDLGLYRLNKDVISKNPDIVFVEFAVNDQATLMSNPVQVQQNMECIIRQLMALNHQPIVIMLYNATGFSACQEVVDTYAPVMEKYGIGEIFVGKYINDNLATPENPNGKYVWSPADLDAAYTNAQAVTDDNVHPNVYGGNEYANYIIQELTNNPDKYFKQMNMPSIYYTWKAYNNPRLISWRQATYSSEWTETSDNSAYFNDGAITTTTPGSTLSFTFTGTKIGMYIPRANNAAGTYSIDGGVTKNFTVNVSSGGPVIPLFIASGLNNGQHTISITFNGNQNGLLSFSFGYFLVD